MRDPMGWGVPVLRCGGLTVRLHVFFLAFAAATLYLGWPAGPPSSPSDSRWLQATGDLRGVVSVGLLLLLASVLLHELSHWFVARRLGGAPRELMLGPLGGLTAWPDLATPRGTWLCQVAGPLSNLAVSLLALGLFVGVRPEGLSRGWFDPLRLAWFGSGPWEWTHVVELAFWINWLLFLINLLPAYPFDGGRLLRAGLSVCRPFMVARRRAEITFWVAMGHGLAILLLALVLWKHNVDAVFPIWLALLLLAVVLLVGARRDVEQLATGIEAGEAVAQWGASCYDGGTAEPSTRDGDEVSQVAPGQSPRRPRDAWETPEASPAEDEAEEEAEEERQLDGILSRLHARGMQSLSAQERELLQRASERYRHRLGKRM
jgi:stage IV sporulation protein FB